MVAIRDELGCEREVDARCLHVEYVADHRLSECSAAVGCSWRGWLRRVREASAQARQAEADQVRGAKELDHLEDLRGCHDDRAQPERGQDSMDVNPDRGSTRDGHATSALACERSPGRQREADARREHQGEDGQEEAAERWYRDARHTGILASISSTATFALAACP